MCVCNIVGVKYKLKIKKINVCVPFDACSHAHWTRFVFFGKKDSLDDEEGGWLAWSR